MFKSLNQRGSVIIGALGLAAAAGFVGSAMVVSHLSFVKQSRQAFVRASMTALDSKIRRMANQPQAYRCGSDVAGQQNGASLDCQINGNYFLPVANVPVAGAKCPTAAPCGFRLVLSGPDGAGHSYGYRAQDMVNPLTGVTERTGIFNYQLVYDGEDFSLAPGGRDLDAAGNQFGMALPREMLQSTTLDCVQIDNTRPVFAGFDRDGRPICRGFSPCPEGYYAVSVDFQNVRLNCAPIRTPDKVVDCGDPAGGRMIEQLNWRAEGLGSRLESHCNYLAIPPVTGTIVTTPNPLDGVCGSANGGRMADAPTTNLCSRGTASAVGGSGPWTWTCAGQSGGAAVTCSAQRQSNLTWTLRNVASSILYPPLRDPNGNLCNDGWQVRSYSPVYFTSPMRDSASNGPECPPLQVDPVWQEPINMEGGACANEGQRCHWEIQANWVSVATYQTMPMMWNRQTCVFMECTDEAKCPNGTARDASGRCASLSGVWQRRMISAPASMVACDPGLATGMHCTPVGESCRLSDGRLFQCQ